MAEARLGVECARWLGSAVESSYRARPSAAAIAVPRRPLGPDLAQEEQASGRVKSGSAAESGAATTRSIFVRDR